MEEGVTATLDAPATKQGLPPVAHAKRAEAAAAASATPTPPTSQQVALATLRAEELDTARTMIKVGRLISIAALISLPFIGGSPALRIALAASIGVALVIGALVARRLGNGIGERTMLVLAYSASPGIFLATLYFGIYSAVQLFPALALYFFCRRDSFASAFALYLTNSVAQGVFSTLIISGVIADPGLVVPTLSTPVLIVGHLLVQICFVGAFILGRGSHRATRDAMAKLHDAVLAEARKDALFHEVRQDLDRVLALDAPGRFSDRTFGSYRLGNLIGRGGMGDVYEAAHVETGESAAVKLLAVRELGDAESVQRFSREVDIVRRLTSPHVVRVFASDVRGEFPYLVMERLRGRDLSHHLRTGRLGFALLDEMLSQVGAAVEEAWRQGIVHRDLKPQNLMLVDGEPHIWKVLDFGVAALVDHSGTLTQGKIVGTPAYMAPEQARGERVDHRADVYALGAIAYRWLTGRPVVAGKDLHTALYQTVNVMPACPSHLAQLHPDFDAVLAIALVKQPADRWDSVDELRRALVAAHGGALDDATRRRAADLIAKTPWGPV